MLLGCVSINDGNIFNMNGNRKLNKKHMCVHMNIIIYVMLMLLFVVDYHQQ